MKISFEQLLPLPAVAISMGNRQLNAFRTIIKSMFLLKELAQAGSLSLADVLLALLARQKFHL